jgi:hypothetical protein
MEGMIKIWSAPQLYQVELAKQKLEDNGIEAFVIDKTETIAHVTGFAELYVYEKDAAAAEDILQPFYAGETED